MGPIFERFKNWFGSLDRAKRPVYLAGLGVFVVMIIAAAVFSGRPQMSMLFGGLSPADQGMVVEELTKIGIRADIDAAGNVFVPAPKVAEARMKLATARKLPNSGSPGMATIDSIGPMVSESVEREKLKSAQESELSRSIATISGVSGARVHLTLKKSSPFSRDETPATASIMIAEGGSEGVNSEQAQSIARLVQYAVEGLKLENITIVSEKGTTLFDGSQSESGGGISDHRLALEREVTLARERDLQQILDGAVGVGNTIVDIPVLKINQDRARSKSTTRGPSQKPVVKEEVKEDMGDANANPANGIAGAASNTQPPAEGAAAVARNYKGSQTRVEYEINETITETEKAPGEIELMAVNVLVNSRNIKDIESVRQFVQNSLGPLVSSPERFTATVTPIEFDTTQQEAAKKSEGAAASSARMQQIISLLPIAALLFVGFLVSKSLGKSAKAKLEDVQRDGDTASLPGNFDLSALTSFTEDEAGMVTLRADELQQLADLPAEEMAHAINAISHRRRQRAVEIDEIPDKINIPLEQIKQMAAVRPEKVAGLIKSMLLEDRR